MARRDLTIGLIGLVIGITLGATSALMGGEETALQGKLMNLRPASGVAGQADRPNPGAQSPGMNRPSGTASSTRPPRPPAPRPGIAKPTGQSTSRPTSRPPRKSIFLDPLMEPSSN